MGRALAFAAALVAALIAATGSIAAPARDYVAGYGTIAADPYNGDQFAVAASSDPAGNDPQGIVVLRTLTGPNGVTGQWYTYHGDVSAPGGCVRIVGNKGSAVGRLPESEQFDVVGFGRVEYVAVIAQDNGRPQGRRPVDQAATALLKATSAAAICNGIWPFGLVPVDQGDFVVQDALLP